MLKLTKTGIGLLTKQYRSVLRKCIWINSGICILLTLYSNVASGYNLCFDHSVWNAYLSSSVVITPHNCDVLGAEYYLALNLDSVATKQWITSNYYTKSDIYNKSEVQNIQSLNYYYTKAQTDSAISSAISGYATQSWVTGKGYLTSVATGNIANSAVTDAKIASGITASKITQTSSYRFVTDAEKSTWNAKQNALSTAQLNAVNSGITAAKVSTYDGYATTIAGKADKATTLSGYGITNAYTKTETDSAISQAISGFVTNDVQSLNYYYTFRVDERAEVIEFAEELRSNKKEMSSLDFMPIKSSSDLRINCIKAEDPLTFSVKTRDDSLVLMEVCHA